MPLPTGILAYLGPETVLPMTSVVATIVGVLMMCGRSTLRFLFRWHRPKDAASGEAAKNTTPRPHFRNEASPSPSSHEADRA
jgi:hypothetical protein